MVLGLGTETVGVERKRYEMRRFFDAAASDAWRQDLLARYGVAYVLVGPRERALGGFDPARAPYLYRAYEDRGYAIYRVVE